ncbi:MAG: outer membrane protein assembly factor BamA [Myxococcota bacterium]
MSRTRAAILLLVAGLLPAAPLRAQEPDPGPRSPGAPAPSPPAPGEPPEEAPGDDDDDDLPLPGDEGDEPYAAGAEPPQIARTPRTICHGRRIRRIRVGGAQRVDPDDIRATLQLRPGTVCIDMEVTRGARALWELGFFEDIVVEGEPVGSDEIDLVVRVQERPAIGKITYVGHDDVEKKDIEEKVTLRQGEILSLPDVQKQITRIRDVYAEEGFFLAQVDYELKKMPKGEVEVRFIIDEGGEVTVRTIRFVGNRALPGDELLDIMQTSETGFFSFITSSNTFNREAFEQDVLRLQAYYYDKGYLEMQTGRPRIELTPDREHIDITIPVNEGSRFKIGGIRVAEVDDAGQEVEPLGGPDRLREMVTQEPGEWFSRSEIGTTLQEITRFYRDRGYARTEVVPETDLRAEDRIVDVRIAIRRGPLVRVERINVRGNTKTRDQVIRREMEILENELYNQSAIEKSKERIQRLGYFERVDVSEERGSSPDRVVLNFEVAEQPTGTFQVGAGFSSIESFILTAQIQQQNLFGNGQSLSLNVQLSGIRQLAQVQFVEPYLLGTEWSLQVNALKTIQQFPDFLKDTTGGGFGFGHPIFDNRLRFFIRYRGEFVDIQARTGGLFGLGGRGGRFGALPGGGLPLANLFQDGFTSSLSFQLTWDSRNNRMFPTDGWHAQASAEVADRFLGSENVFTRYTAFARFYKKLFGPFVLKMNTELGLITSRAQDGVPIFERFFLGGIYTVRGFNLYSLGPRLGVTDRADPTAAPPPLGIAIGGNLQAFYNIEIEFPIVESLGIRGVVFTDGGNAWNLEDRFCQAPDILLQSGSTDPCNADLTAIRASWGFGFRWFSPLGPLRFEWGLPINPKSYEDAIQFEFTIGNFF